MRLLDELQVKTKESHDTQYEIDQLKEDLENEGKLERDSSCKAKDALLKLVDAEKELQEQKKGTLEL